MNRGRIQAQGNSTEKSSAWAEADDIPKSIGILKVDELENQLTPRELRLRTLALNKARRAINSAPIYGISADMKKSYYDNKEKRAIRIDIEVNKGVAFIDDPEVHGVLND